MRTRATHPDCLDLSLGAYLVDALRVEVYEPRHGVSGSSRQWWVGRNRQGALARAGGRARAVTISGRTAVLESKDVVGVASAYYTTHDLTFTSLKD